MSLFPSPGARRRRRAPFVAAVAAVAALLASPASLAAAAEPAGPEPTASVDPTQPIDLTVLQFNLWGKTTGADILREVGADVIFVEEAQNGARALATALGFEYHSTGGSAGVISRFPIVDASVLSAPGTQGGWMKAVLQVGDTQIAAYSGHLEYRFYANYLPRGYAGDISGAGFPSEWRGWNKLTAPVTDVDRILAANEASRRPAGAAILAADMAQEREAGRLAIAGMDMNEASVFDWDERTAELYDHRGTVVPWQTTRVLDEAGLVDAYRSTYPDPVTHPGMTWPADNPNAPVSSLAWAPEADERDRIDYVFYAPDERLALAGTRIVGPRGDIIRGQRALQDTEDPIYTPEAVWTSDHKALQADFVVCGDACQEARDTVAPTVTVKDDSIGADGEYERVSFTLFDEGRIDRVVLNGVVKDLVDDRWSDLNGVRPGVFGARLGENVLEVFDVAGNVTTVTFTLVEPKPAVPAWVAGQVYDRGDTVAHEGAVYLAQWWTTEEPGASVTGSWMEQGAVMACAEGDVAAWTASQVYTGGEHVVHDGRVYAATWWTRNQQPGDQWGPWAPLGAC